MVAVSTIDISSMMTRHPSREPGSTYFDIKSDDMVRQTTRSPSVPLTISPRRAVALPVYDVR